MKRGSTHLVVGVLAAVSAGGAVFTTTLQSGVVAAWEKYIERAERGIATGRAALNLSGDAAALNDLNPSGSNAGDDIRGGYIHDWIGAVLLPNTSVDHVEAVLEHYGGYVKIYGPRAEAGFSFKKPARMRAGRSSIDVRTR